MLRYARDQLRACAIEDTSPVKYSLAELIALGECYEVYVGNDSYLAPSPAHWVPVGGGIAAYLGVASPPEEISLQAQDQEVVRKIRMSSEEDKDAVEAR